MTQKWVSGSPQSNPKVTPKVTFCPEKVTFESLLGLKSYFRGYFGGDPETHFWVTFELLLILRGFGGFRGAGFSQIYLQGLSPEARPRHMGLATGSAERLFFSPWFVQKTNQKRSAKIGAILEAPKEHPLIGARQKGDSKWEKPVSAKICSFLRKSCENLRFPAVFCANLRLPNPLIYKASRKSAKICKNLRECALRVRFLPFAVSLLARPGLRHGEKWNSSKILSVATPAEVVVKKKLCCLRKFQKNPRVRKIRVRNSGAGNGCANFMGARKKCVLSAGKTMSVKFPFFGGGFGGGGGECRFYFDGRADFSENLWETDFYTPPVLGGVAAFDNSAPAVYKNPVPKDPPFYIPLALKWEKMQHLPALEVYKSQSPTNLGGEKLLEKCGLNTFWTRFGSFRIFSAFFKPFFVSNYFFFAGAISFCRCATLKISIENLVPYQPQSLHIESGKRNSRTSTRSPRKFFMTEKDHQYKCFCLFIQENPVD